MFSLQQNQRRGGCNSFCPEVGVMRNVAQIMYTHVNKCKNDKLKLKNYSYNKEIRKSTCFPKLGGLSL
jgi:hypothetical protein